MTFALEWGSSQAVECFTPVTSTCDYFVRPFKFIAALFVGTLGLIPWTIKQLLPQSEFLITEGQAPAQNFARPFTHLSLNVCMFPGGLPQLFGGVAPWWKRVDAIAEIVLREDPDVFCGQEVHAPGAAQALIEALKDDYAYFVHDIGPKTLIATYSFSKEFSIFFQIVAGILPTYFVK